MPMMMGAKKKQDSLIADMGKSVIYVWIKYHISHLCPFIYNPVYDLILYLMPWAHDTISIYSNIL